MSGKLFRWLLICCIVLVSLGNRSRCGGQDSVGAALPVNSDIRSGVVVLSTYLASQLKYKKMFDAARAQQLSWTVLSADATTPEQLEQALQKCKYLVIDMPHRSVAQAVAERLGDVIERSDADYVLVGEMAAVTSDEPFVQSPLQAERGVSPLWAKRLREYWRFGGNKNTHHAIKALNDQFVEQALPLPIVLPSQGFYHPNWPNILDDHEAMVARLNANPEPSDHISENPGNVAIAVNPAVFTSEDTEWLDTLIKAIERRGHRAYAFFGPRQNADLFFEMTRFDDGRESFADVLINAALVFKPNERKTELERIGIPVLQTLPALAMNRSQWQASSEGLALVDISYYYTSSELAGMIDPLLISARDDETGGMQPLEDQIEELAAKAVSIIRLRQSTASQRRVAMMVYNYPQGEANFGASFLNVPKSVENILRGMKAAGYQTDVVPADDVTNQIQRTLEVFYRPSLANDLVADDLAATLSVDDYLGWFRTLPPDAQQRIQSYWGPAESAGLLLSPQNDPAELGNAQRCFVIPRVKVGNVLVMPQPLRHPVNVSIDLRDKKSRIGHRSTVPLSHQYLATYCWIRLHWKANAVVHLGTHGTLEWSPGKERGLSVSDDPYLAMGDLHNVYPYIMDNLGEAITAKRRGRAVIISHLTPMFTPAGFRPGLHEMHDLMHDWETVAPGPVRQSLQSRLVELFVEHQLHRDLGWSEAEIAEDFGRFIEELHPYLDDIAQSAQPQGLAVFGEVPSPERRFGMVMQTLRKPMIDALGEDIDEVFLLDSEKVLQSRPARWLQVALQDAAAASKLDLRIDDAAGGPPSSVPNRAEAKVLDPQELFDLATRAQQLERELSGNEELASLLMALDGRHIASSYGGDPVRNPESLPTGRNLYGFDPSRVPTRQAWEIGVDALGNWLEQYQAAHDGKLPKKVAYSLWAGETMRHQGVMESQVLWAMGVKPIWDDAGRVIGIETVSSAELGRPRIDVLLSVTGSYRDQFPLVMQWIDQAVQHVSGLNEPENFVATHTNALKDTFRNRGLDDQVAGKLAGNRLFSSESGGYGTGLSDAVLATDVWNDSPQEANAEMSALFIERMGHGFGSGLEGAAASEAFAQHLSQVDAAMMSRTSHTYGVLTSDDPFQYLGGLSLAVRSQSGRSPALYVQNLRDENEVIIDGAAVAIAKEVNSRYLHPQWIKSQQAEGYSGTLQVLKSVQFLWGWQVMDPQTVREDQWQSFYDVYVRDRYAIGTQDWLRESNQAAFAQILERMLDAVRLKHWAPDEITEQELIGAYLQAAERSGLIERNGAVTAFAKSLQEAMVADSATTPESTVDTAAGQTTSSNAIESGPTPGQSDPAGTKQRVSGLKLESVAPKKENQITDRTWWAIGICFALLVLGGLRRARQLHAKTQA